MHWRMLRSPAFLVSLLVLLGGAAGLRAAISAKDIYLTKKPIQAEGELAFHSMPRTLGAWNSVGADAVLTKEILETLGTQNYLSRNYIRTVGERTQHVELHLAYYTGMVDTVPHVPERCFVGGGMLLDGTSRIVPVPLDLTRFTADPSVDASKHGRVLRAFGADHLPIRLPRDVENLRLNVTRFRDTASDRLIYAGYFFIANGGVVPKAEDVRLLAFNLTDDYAYYAKVQFTSASVSSEEELASLAADVLNAAFPEIMRRVPDWVDVVEGRYPPDNPRAAKPG